MRFMLFVYPAEHPAAPEDMPVDAVEAMTRFNEELVSTGALLAADGLHPGTEGGNVTFGSGGRPTVTDGPYAEAKELVGGYWIIQARSTEEALEWASRAPMGPGDRIEVRRIYEMEDHTPEVQAAAELSQTPPEQTSDR
jgi:hypothetical protein